MISDIEIEVDSGSEIDRIFAKESSRAWVVVSGPIVVQSRFRVRFAGGVLERIRQRSGRRGLFAERIEGIGLGKRARRVRERCDCAQAIRVVEAGRSRTQHSQRLVYVKPLCI